MKKIINGRRYDTESAKFIGEDTYGGSVTDFQYWAETLYQKRTGEFFIYGKGGPMSRYAVSCGQNEWTGGAQIIPIEPERAREWAEEHLTADEYEEIFGEVSEDDGKRTVTYSLPESVIAKIKAESLKTGKTFSEIVSEAVMNI